VVAPLKPRLTFLKVSKTKRTNMKKLLKEFIEKKSIKNLFATDFIKFAKSKNSHFLESDLTGFFIDEKNRIKKRDEDYEKKRVRKTISFTNEEFEKITENLNLTNLDFSNFAKNILLKKKIVTKVEKNLISEINKIGVNLNQIAKSVNKSEKVAVLTQLVEIEKALKDLKK